MVSFSRRQSSSSDSSAEKICQLFKLIFVPTIFIMSIMIGMNRSFQNDIMYKLNTPSKTAGFSISIASPSTLKSYDVCDKCKNLPQIRPSGEFFLDNKVQNVESADDITPSFHIGSYLGDRVRYHMADDKVHFQLIQELLQKKSSKNKQISGLALDFGANQGFFTYYLAALGMDVHAFEIESKNFASLMHGRNFNPKDVSDRVYLYPIGLDQKISRFGLNGGHYEGFLKDSEDGPILGITFDCFAYHSKLDFSNVGLVKLDVEGFEIAVLKGAAKSLFHRGNKIGGMLMEVGPKRWSRAQIDFESGLEEMQKLAKHFKRSHLIIRASGSFAKSCPTSLVEDGVLADDKPRELHEKNVYRVEANEWDGLLKKMEENDYDCNFWYTN